MKIETVRYMLRKMDAVTILTESSEVLRSELGTVLGREAILGSQVITDGVLLANGASRASCVGGREQVLTDEALDVTRVAGHLLVTDVVVGSVDPVLRVATSIAEDNLILVNLRHE
jgi:hypothetical protein